eukprot:5670162-Pyramimonas_sp.AAC.1
MYKVESIIVGPDELGWPVRRPRRISILIHTSKVPGGRSERSKQRLAQVGRAAQVVLHPSFLGPQSLAPFCDRNLIAFSLRGWRAPRQMEQVPHRESISAVSHYVCTLHGVAPRLPRRCRRDSVGGSETFQQDEWVDGRPHHAL